MIDTRGGSGAESERLTAEGKEHAVEIGDLVAFDGVTYRIAPDDPHHVMLVTT